MKHSAALRALVLVTLAGTPAMAQSLFRRPAPPPPSLPENFPGGTPAGPGVRGETPATSNPADHHQPGAATAGDSSLKQVSLLYVEAPKPRSYEVHDKVGIIISESSSQSSQQKLDAKKDAHLKAAVNEFPDI